MNILEQLKNINSFKELANLLEYNPKTLSYIVYGTSNKYRFFQIPKKTMNIEILTLLVKN